MVELKTNGRKMQETQKMQSIKKGPFKAKVLENRKISTDSYLMRIENKEVAQNALPGQFVSVLCDDLVLRRPFSVANTYGDSFDLIYKVVGQGTEFMTNYKVGDIADIAGPMGNSFTVDAERPLLIGCGVGIAPILLLKEAFEKKSIKPATIMGARSEFKLDGEFDYVLTEDGSCGLKGRLDHYLEKIVNDLNPDKIYICGPTPAMKYVSNFGKEHNIKTEVALEGEFACGTGACMGCVRTMTENGEIVEKRVCRDGPVFKGEEVIW